MPQAFNVCACCATVYMLLTAAGFVTSGLELWHGEKCAEKFFRHVPY